MKNAIAAMPNTADASASNQRSTKTGYGSAPRNSLLIILLLLLTSSASAQQVPVPQIVEGPHTVPVNRIWIEGWKKPFVIRESLLSEQRDLHVDDEQCGREGQCGAITNCGDGLIVYDPHQSLQEVKIDVYHEIQHAITFCTNTALLTHQFIYATSKPMFRTFSDKRNKELTKWLFGN